jgi:hypothetical protein
MAEFKPDIVHPSKLDWIKKGDPTLNKLLPQLSDTEESYLTKITSNEYTDLISKIESYTGMKVQESNLPSLIQLLMQSLQKARSIEQRHKRHFEEWAVMLPLQSAEFKMVEKAITSGDLKIDAKLEEPDLSAHVSNEPEEGELSQAEEINQDIFDQMSDIEATSVEAIQRRFANLLTTGGASHKLYLFNMIKEKLEGIDKTLPTIYGILASLAQIGYWITPDGIEKMAAASGEAKAGSEEVKPEGDTYVIKARAVTFPYLVHEVVKGIYEWLSLYKEHEPEMGGEELGNETRDMLAGPGVFKKFISHIPPEKQHLTPLVQRYAVKLSPDEIKSVLADSGSGKMIMNRLIKQAEAAEAEYNKEETPDQLAEAVSTAECPDCEVKLKNGECPECGWSESSIFKPMGREERTGIDVARKEAFKKKFPITVSREEIINLPEYKAMISWGFKDVTSDLQKRRNQVALKYKKHDYTIYSNGYIRKLSHGYYGSSPMPHVVKKFNLLDTIDKWKQALEYVMQSYKKYYLSKEKVKMSFPISETEEDSMEYREEDYYEKHGYPPSDNDRDVDVKFEGKEYIVIITDISTGYEDTSFSHEFGTQHQGNYYIEDYTIDSITSLEDDKEYAAEEFKQFLGPERWKQFESEVGDYVSELHVDESKVNESLLQDFKKLTGFKPEMIKEMKKETLDNLKRKFQDKWSSNKYTIKSINDVDTSLQKNAFSFIQKLINFGAKLDDISTNDWEHSSKILVYVKNKAFGRFSDFDLRRALRAVGKEVKDEDFNPQAPVSGMGIEPPKLAGGQVVREELSDGSDKGVEPLVDDFINVAGLSDEERATIKKKIQGYYKTIYDRTKSSDKAYDITKKWADKTFTRPPKRKAEKQAEFNFKDEEIGLFREQELTSKEIRKRAKKVNKVYDKAKSTSDYKKAQKEYDRTWSKSIKEALNIAIEEQSIPVQANDRISVSGVPTQDVMSSYNNKQGVVIAIDASGVKVKFDDGKEAAFAQPGYLKKMPANPQTPPNPTTQVGLQQNG